MSLVDSRLSDGRASGPSTLNFDISDMSITPTARGRRRAPPDGSTTQPTPRSLDRCVRRVRPREPQRVLPAGGLTEPRSHGGQPVVDRRASDAAAGLPLEGRPDPVAEQHPEALDVRSPRNRRGLVRQRPVDGVGGDVDRVRDRPRSIAPRRSDPTTEQDAEAVEPGSDEDAVDLRAPARASGAGRG